MATRRLSFVYYGSVWVEANPWKRNNNDGDSSVHQQPGVICVNFHLEKEKENIPRPSEKKEKERGRNKNEENISCGFWAKSKQRPFFSPAVTDARVQKQQVFRFSGLQQLASFPFPSKWLSTRAPNDGSCCCASSSSSSTPLYHHHPVTTTTTTWPALRFVRPIAPEDCPTETSHNLSYLSQVRMKKTKNKSLVSIHVSKQEKCVAAALSLMRWKTFVIVIDSTSYVPLLFSSIFNWRWSLPVYGAPSIIKTSRSSHYLSTVIKWNRADPQKPSTNQTIGRETGSVGNQVPFLFFERYQKEGSLSSSIVRSRRSRNCMVRPSILFTRFSFFFTS